MVDPGEQLAVDPPSTSSSAVDRWLAAEPRIEIVSVNSLQPADSPRRAGESKTHVRLMVASESELPPIVVHRPTNRVIDGMHRLHAAKLQNRDQINARFFDGSEEEAFMIAVTLNVEHGLPLCLKDRKAAAARILTDYPQWSDRMIGTTTGLSHGTVAAVRRNLPGQRNSPNKRIGKDGRRHPVDPAKGRQAAAEVLHRDSSASLREVADQTGVSLSTASDVRSRLQHKLDPVANRPFRDSAIGEESPSDSRRAAAQAQDHRWPRSNASDSSMSWHESTLSSTMVMQRLRSDPALRYNEDGRALLRLLTSALGSAKDAQRLADSAPVHSRGLIGNAVALIAETWNDVAAVLQRTTELDAECG